MEFPENIAQQIGSDSVGATRAWRHQMICKLIDAGVTNPDEIKHSVDSLYEFVVSPIKKAQEAVVDNKDQEKEFIKTNVVEQQMRGSRILNELINQANLNQDQLDDIKLYIDPYSFLNSKKV